MRGVAVWAASTLATRTHPGRSEDTNGLLRQYLPRRTDFKTVTQSDLDQIAAELNDRPRQTLKWKSPCQALDEALR